MDLLTDLPPATAESDAQAADAGNHAHPPYSEMILAAISALKDKDGSSRQAITRYIEKEYTNLPPTHAALLTHHLKRLKNEGQLMMIKHSYALPRSPRSATDTVAATTSIDANNTPSTSGKRKPGRPPKPRTDSGFQLPEVQPVMAEGEIQLYEPQFQNQMVAAGQDISGPNSQGYPVGAADPIFASLGLSDEGPPPPENTVVSPKRGRGRPPKVGGGSGSGSFGGGGGGSGSGGAVGSRKRGRPKLLPVVMANGRGAKRGRGRPPRIGIGGLTVPLSGNALRPRGRPKKAVGRPSVRPAQNVDINGGAGGSDSVAKRRGRPPKRGGVSKNEPGTSVVVSDPQQHVAYQELKFKYEHLQSKAKEVVNVVKPYINRDYGTAALGALDELGALAGAQGNEQAHEPPPSSSNMQS